MPEQSGTVAKLRRRRSPRRSPSGLDTPVSSGHPPPFRKMHSPTSGSRQRKWTALTCDGCSPYRFLAHIRADAKMSRTDAADEAAQARCSEICESCPNDDFATSRAPHLVYPLANDLMGDMCLLGDKTKK